MYARIFSSWSFDACAPRRVPVSSVKELVAYTPGTAFYADGGGRNKMRLAFCYPTPDFIREGIRRLSTVINGELELLSTFSQTTPLPVVRPEPTMINPPANLG